MQGNNTKNGNISFSPSSDKDGIQLNLVEIFYRTLEKFYLIVIFAVIGAIVGGVYIGYTGKTTYTARAKLYLVDLNSSASEILSALNAGRTVQADYLQVFNNWIVHEEVISNLNLPYSYTEIANMLYVTKNDSSNILTLYVTASTPEEAKLIVDEYCNVGAEFIKNTMNMVKPSVFEPALMPSATYPNKTKYVSIGFFGGAVFALGIIVLMCVLDRTVKSPEDLEGRFAHQCLGVMPLQIYDENGNLEHGSDHSNRSSTVSRRSSESSKDVKSNLKSGEENE